MKDPPLISIIIPTLNEEENMKRCLHSIFSQSYPRKYLEVIVVDNYSEDNTLKIAKKPFNELTYEDFEIIGYEHDPFIKFKVAV